MSVLKDIKRLEAAGDIKPPAWLVDNTQYLVIVGSQAYGCALDTSDKDINGWCIEPKVTLFPHITGFVNGFDDLQNFKVWQKHHVQDTDKNVEYDFNIYGLANYFKLMMDGNPNMVETLWVPRECVALSTSIGEMVRTKRSLFLSKRCAFKTRMYGFSQLSKLDRTPDPNGKRYDNWVNMGFDTKYASHVVRLMLQAEMILEEHIIDLPRNGDKLKAIRAGVWTKQEIQEWANEKEKHLEKLETESDLRPKADSVKIKELLLECLEHHYGSLDKLISQSKTDAEKKIEKITEILFN